MSNKSRKMTLLGYYKDLPEANFPKTVFVNTISLRAGVSAATVHNWIHGKTKPTKKEQIEILCKVTGLKENELWQE